MFIIWCLIGTILQCLSLLDATALPTVVWDPRSPIFACDEPVLNVKLNDQLNFICPHKDLLSFVGAENQISTAPYENLYFLGTDNLAFRTCNATGWMSLLRCSYDSSSPSIYNMVFRHFMTGPNTLSFLEGETYYLIGTGYRLPAFLDNTVGGSCNKSEEKGYHKLRLKIYICTEDDVHNGKCDICQSEGCYYKDCSTSCNDWMNDRVTKESNNCTILQKRECFNFLLGKTEYEFQELLWPCDKESPIGASNFGFAGSPLQRDNRDTKMYLYLVICISIVAFVLGIAAGGVTYKWYYLKRCSQRIPTSQSNTIVIGLDNKNYQ